MGNVNIKTTENLPKLSGERYSSGGIQHFSGGENKKGFELSRLLEMPLFSPWEQGLIPGIENISILEIVSLS